MNPRGKWHSNTTGKKWEFQLRSYLVKKGRIWEEKRHFFAFCAVQNRQVMILPYHHFKNGSERVFLSVGTEGRNGA